MKRIIRKNQMVITALAVMIAVAGYLTYAGRSEQLYEPTAQEVDAVAPDYDTYVAGTLEQQTSAVSPEGQNAEAEVTREESVQAMGEEGETAETAASANLAADAAEEQLADIDSLDYDIEDPGEAVLANGLTITDFMAQAKLNREQVRGQNREDLLSMIDNGSSDEVSRENAVAQMVTLTQISDMENAAETLLSAKGFANSIVSMTGDTVDVLICENSLSDAQLAQIEDIVKRKTQAEVSQITITLMKTQADE